MMTYRYFCNYKQALMVNVERARDLAKVDFIKLCEVLKMAKVIGNDFVRLYDDDAIGVIAR